MSKPKFKPVITRVKLNPEQAVLACNCYSAGWRHGGGTMYGTTPKTTTCNWGTNKVVYGNATPCTTEEAVSSTRWEIPSTSQS